MRNTVAEFETTLADDILWQRNYAKIFEESYYRRMIKGLQSSVRMRLTPEATIKIWDTIHYYPEFVLDNSEFALPPFERCWIEYPVEALHNYVGVTDSREGDDTDVGYLFIGNEVYVGSRKLPLENAQFNSYMFKLNTPDEQGYAELCKSHHITRESFDALAWGAKTYRSIGPVYRTGLSRAHGMRSTLSKYAQDRLPAGSAQATLGTLAGELKYILGMLLMLNQPKSMQITEEVRGRSGRIGAHYRTLLDYNIIDITLNKTKLRKTYRYPGYVPGSGGRGHHEVEGHFVHNKVARTSGCPHCDEEGNHWWVQLTPKRWECLNCGGKRTWRTYPNGWGDRSKHESVADYVVKT